VLAYLIALAGFAPLQEGALSFNYVAALLLLDTTVVIGLIFWLLARHGERPWAVFIGDVRIGREAALGLLLTPPIFAAAVITLGLLRQFTPWLHDVAENPLEELIRSGRHAFLFAIVATIGGGLREEIQRAFIVHRFRQHLGGAWIGLVLYSVVFGLGHRLQGWDAVLTTALLGLSWGAIYIARHSIVASVVSHSGFNATQIAQYVLLGR
jgi:membrane protease YdiL (CAAX protease family)